MEFSDCDQIEAAAQAVIEGDDEVEAKVICLGHRFQRLDSLVIFVEEAFTTEALRSYINRLSIIGHQAQDYHAVYK